MADMPSDFWSGWIIVLSSVGFLGLAWFVLSFYFMDPGPDFEDEGPVWDSSLREGNSSPPIWWFWLILSMMVISVIYLMLYPGLGSFKGAFQWSQGGQFAEHTARYDEEFAELESNILALSYTELSADVSAMDTAASIFTEHCSACHGSEASGQANLFPDLTDSDWQWGASPVEIEQTIRNGRLAVMISWQAVLNDQGVNNVAEYVLSMADGINANHPGKMQYDTFCFACHGSSGEGNPALGAPRLNDNIWLYGGDIETIKASIAVGRNGQMPAFGEILDEVQIKLLTAWLSR